MCIAHKHMCVYEAMLSMKSKDLTLFRLGGSNVPATPKVLSKLRKTTNIKKQKKSKT